MEFRLSEPKMGGQVEIDWKDVKRTSKVVIDRRNKAGLGEIRDTKLAWKSTQSRRVEGNGNGGKNWRVVMLKRRRNRRIQCYGILLNVFIMFP